MAEAICFYCTISGMLFPPTPYGATWSVLCYADDVASMGLYAWAEII